MLDRRRFLIGASALLTASFVSEARAFSRKAGEPLILPSAHRRGEMLVVYRWDQFSECGGKWRVSLGPNQPFAPPPPTWREHLRSLGHRLETEAEIERICAEISLAPEEFDRQLDGFGWVDMWDNFTGEGVSFAEEARSWVTQFEAQASRTNHFRGVRRRTGQLLHLGGAQGRPDGFVAAGPPHRVGPAHPGGGWFV